MGTLYIQTESGGEKIPLQTIPTLEIGNPDEESVELPNFLYCDGSVEFGCKSIMNRNLFIQLVYGIPITNNWLKMHGGIMSRKKRRRS